MEKKTFLIICLISILLNLLLVCADQQGCIETLICDDSGSYWDGSEFKCYSSSVSDVDLEEVFSIDSIQRYDCDGTETFEEDYVLYKYEETSDGYPYHNRSFGWTGFSETCSDSDQYWESVSGIIHDLNSNYGSLIYIKNHVLFEDDSTDICSTKSHTVTPTGESDTITGNYKVFSPYPDKVTQITEPSFEPISGLIMVNYYNTSESTSRSNQQDYIDGCCSNDGFDPNMCHTLSSVANVRNYVTNHITHYLQYAISGSTTFGGTSLSSDSEKALLYHFNNTRSPIYINTYINWTYYVELTPYSFTGYHYAFVLLGMEDQGGGVYQYWVQYPDGGRYKWTQAVLDARWGGSNNYQGFYFIIDSNVDDPDIGLRSNSTGLNMSYDPVDGYLLLNLSNTFNYILLDESTDWFYETDDSRAMVDHNDDGSYDTDWFGTLTSRESSEYLPISSSGSYEFEAKIQGKSDYAYVTKNYTIINQGVITADNLGYIYYTDDDVVVQYTGNLFNNNNCSIYNADNSSFATTFSNFYNLTQSCILDLTFGGSPLFDGGENVSIYITSAYEGDHDYFVSTPFFYKTMNYPLNISSLLPSQCVINQTCNYIDNNSLTNSGSWDNFQQLYADRINYITLDFDNNNLDPSLDCVYEIEPSVLGASPSYENYLWDIDSYCIYQQTGNYSVEVCMETEKNQSACAYFYVDVSESFGGGGGSGGGSSSENSTGFCSYNLEYDIYNLGDCQQQLLRHYWYDVDDDDVFDVTATNPPLAYSGIDCVDSSCGVVVDRSSLNDADYCDGSDLVANTDPEYKYFNLYFCYDNTNWASCDCDLGDVSFSSWIDAWGFDTGICSGTSNIDQPGNVSFDSGDCSWLWTDGLVSTTYRLCDDNEIYNSEVGEWCSPYRITLECEYDCTTHDFDSDGVDDCDDVCCGYDDNDDADSDGIPDGCDICPDDSDNDIDSDGICGDVDNCPDDYNPLQTDSDNDDYGNVCDICEGGDDDDDADDDGIPDYCDSGGGGDLGDGDDGDLGENGTGWYGFCGNNVLDSHINETYVDYGGLCGTCDNGVLDWLLGETEIDYGGKCGVCIEGSTKEGDVVWQTIIEKSYPFDDAQCEEGSGILMISFLFLILIMLIIVLFLLGFGGVSFLLSYIFWWLLFGSTRKSKNNKKKDKNKRKI